MAPINDAVFLRRNNQIQDAIDGQNLKQALQLIEKRMKKGENTRFLKVGRASLLAIGHFCPLSGRTHSSCADCR
jgi:N-terminal acetyltransferase B complex non-catalytic subunit